MVIRALLVALQEVRAVEMAALPLPAVPAAVVETVLLPQELEGEAVAEVVLAILVATAIHHPLEVVGVVVEVPLVIVAALGTPEVREAQVPLMQFRLLRVVHIQ